MGKQHRRPYSTTRPAEEAWVREASLNGVKEIHLKFTVRGDMIPRGCPCIPVEKQVLDKRALQHEVSRGDQFIKNAQAVNAVGVGEELVNAGFRLAGFSHHWKKTLHQGDEKAIVECRFSKAENTFFEWNDSFLWKCEKYAWYLHAYNNVGGIMTLNMVHPQKRTPERQIEIIGEKITVKSIR